jgi:FlaA1/EpsC-like NDP-sugar epimerase
MRRTSGLLARVFDVAMIVSGAMVATHIRFDDISQRSFFTALVAFSAALSLAMFPALGVYASWRGRSKTTLSGQVSLGWIIVQMCVMALMFPLQR